MTDSLMKTGEAVGDISHSIKNCQSISDNVIVSISSIFVPSYL